MVLFRKTRIRAWEGPCDNEIYKGHNSIKNVGGVKVLVLCTLSDNALYLYQVLPKYLKEFQSYCPDSRVDPRVVANVDAGRTHAQMDGKPDPYIVPCQRQVQQRKVCLTDELHKTGKLWKG